MFALSKCGRKTDYHDDTQLSYLVTRLPSHMPTAGIVPRFYTILLHVYSIEIGINLIKLLR